MDLIYKSTRNDNETVTASQAILYGLAKESGLYVPSFIPKMEYPKYTAHSRSKYCVGFLTKYSDVYVLRVFSRNIQTGTMFVSLQMKVSAVHPLKREMLSMRCYPLPDMVALTLS